MVENSQDASPLKKKKYQKSRNYSFTFNNYGDYPEFHAAIDAVPCVYMLYGKEIGEEGTPHLQGYVKFASRLSHASVRKKLPHCHVEETKFPEQYVAYCKKDGDITERGIPPVFSKEKGKNEEERWRNIRHAAEEGRYEDIPERVRFYSKRLIQSHHDDFLNSRKLPDTTAQHLWYHGGPGTGKSYKARTDHPDAYLKMCNKWWDNYEDQPVVIIEDFDKKHDKLCHHLKIWGDRYQFRAELKNKSRVLRPTLIIVTSNYEPKDIWTDAADLEPILRRFKLEHFATLCPRGTIPTYPGVPGQSTAGPTTRDSGTKRPRSDPAEPPSGQYTKYTHTVNGVPAIGPSADY